MVDRHFESQICRMRHDDPFLRQMTGSRSNTVPRLTISEKVSFEDRRLVFLRPSRYEFDSWLELRLVVHSCRCYVNRDTGNDSQFRLYQCG